MAFIEFSYPKYLWAGIIIVILFYLFYHFKLKRKKFASKEIPTTLVLKNAIRKKTIKENIITILMVLSLLSLFVALANPQVRFSSQSPGVNVVLVIDSSGSMTATDFKPTRIASAIKSATGFINQLGPKDNIGIVSFSGSTRIVSFLTNDKQRAINKLSTITPGGATAIGDGLSMGVNMVTSIPNKKDLIILESDGAQNAGQISVNQAISYAKANDVTVYTIGVGGLKPVVLGYDFFGRPQYANLDQKTLSKIANETGGQYFRATDSVSLKQIYNKLPNKFKKEKVLQSIKDWFIGLAIILMIASFIIKYSKRIRLW